MSLTHNWPTLHSLSHTLSPADLSLFLNICMAPFSLSNPISHSLSLMNTLVSSYTHTLSIANAVSYTPLSNTLYDILLTVSLSLTHSLTLSLLSSKYDSSTLLLSPSFIFSIQSEIAWSTCDEGINVFLKQNSINFGRQQPNIKVSMYLLLTKQQPFWQ